MITSTETGQFLFASENFSSATEIVPGHTPSLYATVNALAATVAKEVSNCQPKGDCVNCALRVQSAINNRLGEVSYLQDADVNCGVVLELTRSPEPDDPYEMDLHASNFLLAKLGRRKAVVAIDGFFGETSRIRARSHPLRLVMSSDFGNESVAYAQRRNSRYNWQAGIAEGLRKPPFRFNSYFDRRVILGETVGQTALSELASSSPFIDKTKLPILLMGAR